MSKNFKKPGQWKAYLALAWYSFRAQTRNPATFFFGFIFPIAFISIFGLIGNSSAGLRLGISDDSLTGNPVVPAIERTGAVDIETAPKAELEEQLTQGEIAGIVSVGNLGEGEYEVSLILSTGLPQEASMIKSLVSNIVAQENLKLSGVSDPPIGITENEIDGRQPRYIDFALPGQLGFAMLSTAIFGTVFGLIYLKKAGVLKRMFATPTKPLTILVAQGTSRLIMGLLQVIIILAVGVIFFQFYLPYGIVTFLNLIVVSMVGLIAFLGFGYFLAGIANDENSAGPIVNLVTLPQFLLSGTFFSTDLLPTWIQPLANNLPLSYFNVAVREIANKGASIIEVGPYILGLLVWGIVMYLLAAKTFRWQ